MTFDHDLFVIGGGSGGVRAARMAAEAGASVALAEESRMGGTCVIRGCVPKKLMVYASEFAPALAEARAFGWDVGPGRFDWPTFRTRLHAELDRLEGIYRANLDKAGVEILDTRATLAGPNEVQLADGRRRTARHILIATGGRPFIPDMAQGHVMSSDDVFLMEALPARMLIVGGGYIACEFACILAGMGVEVTQYYRGAQILRGFDGEVRGHIAEAMRARGIDLHVGTDVASYDSRDGGILARASDGREGVFDAVLCATGRRPNTAGLGLEDAGVTPGRWGEVPVDAHGHTAIPSVHAIGDVTDRVNLTPVAIREGAALARTLFGDGPTPVDHDLIPSAVFTQPELGTIGLSEEDARDREPVEVYCASVKPMKSGFAGEEERALVKLIVSAASRRVLGCHIVGEGASEMIQLAAVAVKMGATKEDFDRTVAVHPTMAEEIVLMKTPVRAA